MKWTSAVAVTVLLSLPAASSQPVPGATFEATINNLLLTYGNYKQYGETDPAAVDRRLSDDRRSVLRAIIRSTFIRLTPQPGKESDIPPEARLVDYIQAVHGIWGVRPGDSEGKRQFRLSVKFKPGIRKVMDASEEFRGRWFCHVLLPTVKGGDDDDKAPASAFQWADGAKCKWSRRLPKIQVNYSNADETIGEIDLDFDEGADHQTPANSDVRAYDQSGQESRHSLELNRVHDYVAGALSLKCQTGRPHGRDRYGDNICP